MRRLLLAVLLVVVALAATAPVAGASFGIVPGSFAGRLLDSAGQPELRAGSHPDRMQIEFAFNQVGAFADGNAKDVVFEMPPGLVGNPDAVVKCTREQFGTGLAESRCPPESQIGTAVIDTIGLGAVTTNIYSVQPRPGKLAEFGFGTSYTGSLAVEMSPDGERVFMKLNNLIQELVTKGVSIEIWGVPADHWVDTSAPRRPLLTLPGRCDEQLEVTMRAASWQEPDVWDTAVTPLGPRRVGCEDMRFEPSLGLTLDTATLDAPAGVEASIALPPSDDPDGQATAPLSELRLTLPEGVAISASAANGLMSCSEIAAGLGSGAKPDCPSASRMGNVEIETGVLEGGLSGGIYLGPDLPGTERRLFVIVSGAGMSATLEGRLYTDPVTGQLTTTLSGLPGMPIENLKMSFRGGPRAPLVTPMTCGDHLAVATFEAHGGHSPVVSTAPVSIADAPAGGSCSGPRPFAPELAAGSLVARAGVSSPFGITLTRRDGERLIDRFSVTLPAGMAARVGSVERCEAAAAAECPPASRIGTAVVEAGTGPEPYALEGDVFLTGRYRDAPFGVALVFDGHVGPFDVGQIVTRGTLRIDPLNGRMTVASDALPRIIDGIPLRIRTLALDIDRPGFMVNPTSCRRTETAASVISTDRVTARATSRFALVGCNDMRFEPRLAIALTAPQELHAGGHPGLVLRVDVRQGGSNTRAATVRLPRLMKLDSGGPTALCSREQARDGRCPAGSRIGRARGRTPLLAGPLRGDVYAVQPRGNGLPDFWAHLTGMGISLSLRLEAAIREGRIVTKFVDLPDFPLTDLTLRMASGRRGTFSTTRSPCVHGKPRRIFARAEIEGHSGAFLRTAVPVRVGRDCGASLRAQRRK